MVFCIPLDAAMLQSGYAVQHATVNDTDVKLLCSICGDPMPDSLVI